MNRSSQTAGTEPTIVILSAAKDPRAKRSAAKLPHLLTFAESGFCPVGSGFAGGFLDKLGMTGSDRWSGV